METEKSRDHAYIYDHILFPVWNYNMAEEDYILAQILLKYLDFFQYIVWPLICYWYERYIYIFYFM